MTLTEIKAAVCTAFGAPLRIETLHLAASGADEKQAPLGVGITDLASGSPVLVSPIEACSTYPVPRGTM